MSCFREFVGHLAFISDSLYLKPTKTERFEISFYYRNHVRKTLCINRVYGGYMTMNCKMNYNFFINNEITRTQKCAVSIKTSNVGFWVCQ